MKTSAEKYADLLLVAGMAGKATSHGARGNLEKIHMLLESTPNTTFGMEELLRGVTFEEAYGAVAERIGYAPDHEETPGRGCIDPENTAAGLLQAGEAIAASARDGGRAIFATGHPGALLVYYLGLAEWFEELGGEAVFTHPRIRPDDGGPPLDWVGPVAVMGDGASLKHTHSPEPMRLILAETDKPDIVVADHGFAGAAITASVPTVAIMDTNDPALAVVARREAHAAPLVVVPMDDNRPQNSYTAALEVLQAAAA